MVEPPPVGETQLRRMDTDGVVVWRRPLEVVVTASCGPTTSTIKEGQQITRDDAADCGIAERRPGAVPAAKARILTSPWAEAAGVGAGGALLGWVLVKGDDPVSPHVP